VLVVEDQPDTREIVVATLQQYGVSVAEAATAREALEAVDHAVAARQPLDVIISDIGLPGEDGYRLIEHLSARPPSLGGAIPLIALTAYGRPQDKRRALAAGFRLHLTKPIDPLLLASALLGVTGRSAG
jgi:CheY-like chemotaxis protein